MLIKTLKFDGDVLEIVKGMNWSEDGLLGILTCGQLDRTMYIAVNKALDAMGGKWNRKLGGHVFKMDPRSSVEGLLDSGTLKVERDGFFETPLAPVKMMIGYAWPAGNILEPSAGLGAIVDNLGLSQADKHNVVCIEKNRDRANILMGKGYTACCMDFLNFKGFNRFHRVYMNPPFEQSQDILHVRYAYDCLKYGGKMVAIMSEGSFFREDKIATSFREWLDPIGRSIKLPDGSFKISGTMVNTRIVVIGK